MDLDKIYKMQFSRIYPLYLTKIKRKGRNKDELDYLISWLTGYTADEINGFSEGCVTLEEFFSDAPALNPNRIGIKGSICGVKIQEIKEPLMKGIRYMDKLVDQLYKGKSVDKITEI